MLKKVSIIIPVYNVEKYIEKAIESVQQQILKDLEIICIDDGSTDESVRLLQELMVQDNRVRLLFQQHQGAGCARNLGIREAKGEYVAFLDADDYYLDADALQRMYDACLCSGTAICGSRRKHLQNGELKENSHRAFLQKDILPGQVLSYRDYQMDYDYQSYLFSRKLLLDNQIFFPNYLRYQDPPFMVRAMYAAGQFTYVDSYMYCYRISNSVKKFNAAKAVDLLRALMDNMQFAEEHHLDILWEKTVGRLEYEYADLIVHSIEKNNSMILRLLVKGDEMISRVRQDEAYVIRPLRLIGKAASEWDYRAYLEKLLNRTEHLAIYGAGMMGQSFFKYLVRNHFQEKVRCFLVTSQTGNVNEIQGIPVVSIERYMRDGGKNKDLVVVAVDGCHQKEIEAVLAEKGVEDAELLDTVFLSELSW